MFIRDVEAMKHGAICDFQRNVIYEYSISACRVATEPRLCSRFGQTEKNDTQGWGVCSIVMERWFHRDGMMVPS